MNESLRSAFQEAAALAGPSGDAAAAIAAAGRRRRGRVLGSSAGAAVVVAAIIAGSTLSFDSTIPPADPGTPTSAAPTADQGVTGVRLKSLVGPGTVLYRTCGPDSCTVGLANSANEHLALPSQVAERLAVDGFEGATLSTDGAWIGYPHDGKFTVVNAYDGRPSTVVPEGPPGSTWRPYFWTQDYLDLVLAQWTGDNVTAYAMVHVGYSNTPEMRVVVEPNAHGEALLPVAAGGVTNNVLSLAEAQPVDQTGAWPRVQELQERMLYTTRSKVGGAQIGQPGLSPPGGARDLSTCLRDDETLIGPEGVPMSFTVAPETSPDQDEATVAFRLDKRGVVPSAVVKGCNGPAGSAQRYDLPQSTSSDFWTFLGPIAHNSGLMLHQTDHSLDGELVMVGPDERQTVVGHVPAKTEILAPGMTGGQFE